MNLLTLRNAAFASVRYGDCVGVVWGQLMKAQLVFVRVSTVTCFVLYTFEMH